MRALLLDLDDTLYDYVPAERAARAAMLGRVAADLGRSAAEVEALYATARARVKERVGGLAASHSRLLYLSELVHTAARPDALARVRSWERAFWSEYLRTATLRKGARAFLAGWRRQGNRVALVTDQVLEVQLWKLEALDLWSMVDAVVASEEVAREKPERHPFELAMHRLGVSKDVCIVVGDSPHRDGAGAHALGLPYYRAQSSEAPGEGMSFDEMARALEVTE